MQKDLTILTSSLYDDYFGGREGKPACMRIRASIRLRAKSIMGIFKMAAVVRVESC